MKREKFFYRAYGLNIESDFEINELILLDEDKKNNIDVYIRIGEMSESVKNQYNNGKFKGYNKNNMWFLGGEEALFNVLNGEIIIVEPLIGYNLSLLKIYLLGIAFSLIMIQRGEICLQGGAVTCKDSAILIMGKSGVGKSTLIDKLKSQGYKLLADDMTVITTNGDNIVVNPSIPIQRMCTDTIEALELINKDYEIVNLKKEKYLIPVKENFQYKCIKLRAIIELSINDVNEVEVNEIVGKEKVKGIFNNIFRGAVLNEIGIEPNYFKKCIRVAKTIPMYHIKRPVNGMTVDKQLEFIEEIIYK